MLGMPVPDPGLTNEEKELLASFESITRDPDVPTGRLVLVAIASSVRGLFTIEWGEVALDSSGYVAWVQQSESLLPGPSRRPASSSPTTTFTAGAVPKKFPKTDEVGAIDGDE
jgi:hypothetical protein